MFHATTRLWLTAAGDTLVEDGHPDAALLFAAAGDEIAPVDVERFGLAADRAAPAPAAQTAPVEEQQPAAPGPTPAELAAAAAQPETDEPASKQASKSRKGGGKKR